MRYQKNIGQGGSDKENKTAERPERATNEDVCRCKEVSEMKPRQLLKLMISDLTSRKKKKTG